MDGNLAVDYWVGREEALKLPVAAINQTPGVMNRKGKGVQFPSWKPMWRDVWYFSEAKQQAVFLLLLFTSVVLIVRRVGWSLDLAFYGLLIAMIGFQAVSVFRLILAYERHRRRAVEEALETEQRRDPTLNEMGWADYLSYLNPGAREYVEALRAEIVEKGIRKGGIWHQESGEGFPVFSDGSVAAFNLRSWGDLLAAIWSTEGPRFYSFQEFARYGPEEDEPNERQNTES